MGNKIWSVLDEYAGMWVTIDNGGKVVDSGTTLGELTKRAGESADKMTFVYAAATRGAERSSGVL